MKYQLNNGVYEHDLYEEYYPFFIPLTAFITFSFILSILIIFCSLSQFFNFVWHFFNISTIVWWCRPFSSSKCSYMLIKICTLSFWCCNFSLCRHRLWVAYVFVVLFNILFDYFPFFFKVCLSFCFYLTMQCYCPKVYKSFVFYFILCCLQRNHLCLLILFPS